MSVKITWQPEAERATAVALPIPLAAPVMNAVLSYILVEPVIYYRSKVSFAMIRRPMIGIPGNARYLKS